jgi:HD-GYP domain-containing protein (c-di-GMP phosphodiesterase class II)
MLYVRKPNTTISVVHIIVDWKDFLVSQVSPNTPKPISIRLAEVIASLSIATDLGMGQSLEFALAACVLAMRLAEALGYSDDTLRKVYYQSLLRHIGCNVDTHLLASIVGDEFVLRADFALIDNANTLDIVRLFTRHIRTIRANDAPLALLRHLAQGLLTLPQIKASFAGHCEVAQRLAERLGFEPNIVDALGQLYERWDGKGMPNGLKGEAVAPAVLVVTLAQDALLFHRLGGVESAVEVARRRNGSAYAPHIVECFVENTPRLFTGLDSKPMWDTVLALEPGKPVWLSDNQFDAACRAIADFVDIKSPSTLNHSSQVAELAAGAAQAAGMPPATVAFLRRAGWLHDIGKTGISSAILEKPGPLTHREWEQVRMHTYHGERILSHSGVLRRLGGLASLHHERLDGSGYHRGLPAGMQPPTARILAAANAFQSLLENRPYRPARLPAEAAEILRQEVRAGRLDGDALRHVLGAAGHLVARRQSVAGLSDREIEVLRLLVQGQLAKNIAALLHISPKTADHHIQHIYTKIGVSTRAGATLFAMEHNLLADIP